jgi:poly-gamma-glutamate synthesis protein (capsule biosynthesis protein)
MTAVTLALAGDTMLGRLVAEKLEREPPAALFAPEVVAVAREADLFVLNLECCISTRGARWPDPFKPFFFRAPPRAVEALTLLGVDCVTLANNHALDYGREALLDTLEHLASARIAVVGAGADLAAARSPVVLDHDGFRLGVVSFTDHPAEYAADDRRPGVAFADLRRGVPDWIGAAVGSLDADAVLVTPHWGPNMVPSPLTEIRRAARELVERGASLVAGHSAHVFQGVQGRILYDLGDFVDDYRTDWELRNDLGLLFLVRLEHGGPVRIETVPLKLEFCHTRLAVGDELEWLRRRFDHACAALGTPVDVSGARFVVELPGQPA